MAAFGASAEMKPPSAKSQAFDATCSAWLSRRVDAIPLGLHRLLSDFRLIELLLIGRRTKGALYGGLDLNGFGRGLPPGRGDGDENEDEQAERCKWRQEPDKYAAAGGELDQRDPPLIETPPLERRAP